MTKLIYHTITTSRTPAKESPFDVAIRGMASSKTLKIACPYVSRKRLDQILQDHADWKLLTDVDALFRSLRRKDRHSFIELFRENKSRVRHNEDLHAKVIIADRQALVGSANLTEMGLTKRAEMSVLVSDQRIVEELDVWFEAIFEECEEFSDKDFEEMERFANKSLPASSSDDRENGELSLRPGPQVSLRQTNTLSRRPKKTESHKPQGVSAKVTGSIVKVRLQRGATAVVDYTVGKEKRSHRCEQKTGLVLRALQIVGEPIVKKQIYELMKQLIEGPIDKISSFNINRHTRENSKFALLGLIKSERIGNEIHATISDVGKAATIDFGN